MDAPSITPPARRVMETAARLAQQQGAQMVGPPFMLLALLELPDALTRAMLARLTGTREGLSEHLLKLPASEEPEEQDNSEALAALGELIQATRERSGVPPGDLGGAEWLGLMAVTGAIDLLSDLEALLYDWLIGGGVPDDEQHDILTLLLGLALRRNP